MKIKEITIQKYKSIYEAIIELKDFNVFVGKNNVGKTNFLDCLSFVSELSQSGNVKNIFSNRGGYDKIIYGGQVKNNIHIYVKFMFKRNTIIYDVSLNGNGFIEEYVSINNKIYIERIKIASGVSRSLKIYHSVNEDYVSYNINEDMSILLFYNQYGIKMGDDLYNDIFNELVKAIKSWKFYHLNPSVMRNVRTVSKTYDIGRSGSYLSNALHSIMSSHLDIFKDIEASLSSGIEEIEKLRTPLDNNSPAGTYVSIKEKGFSNYFDLKQISDGTLIILAHLTIINSPEHKSLIGIEEPESYIHPQLLIYLKDVLKSSGIQIVAVTHSPYFVDALKPHDLIIVNKIDGKTQFLDVTSKEQLKKYLKTLTLGELLYSRETEDAVYHKK